jgi:hypothetical protein
MNVFAFVSCAILVVGLATDHPMPRKMVKFENGINHVDIVGDGTPSLIVSGHRENFNAHSFEVVSFYIKAELRDAEQWLIVPIMNTNGQDFDEKLELNVGGGADCLLHDFRLLVRQGDAPPMLVVAKRDKGDFVSREPVTFSYYTLVHNTDGNPGSVPYVFELSRVTTSKSNYCDVDEAMQKELGLGKP